MDFGGLLNSITGMAGIKLFPGGPYDDAGKGDQMQQQTAQYMAQLAPLIAQIAQSSGVGNPLTGQQGQFSQNLYGLSPLQQGNVNQQAGVDRSAYDQILSRVKANLSARGMGDSATMSAAEAYLGQQLQGQLGSERIQAGQNAYDSRMQAMQMIGNLLGQRFGAQQNVTDMQRQQAIKSSQGAQEQLGGLLGVLFGPGGPLGKAAPKQGGVLTGTQESPVSPGIFWNNDAWGDTGSWGGGGRPTGTINGVPYWQNPNAMGA